MYRHIKEYEIRYTDTDAYDVLKPSSLMSFLEESACLSADELGFGYDAIAKKNIGFIIVNAYVELFRPIKLGEKVEIHTWPLRPKFMIFLRDYEIYCSGEKVGVATTRWCMIDTANFSMLPVSAYFGDGAFDNYNTQRSVIFNRWKIAAVENTEPSYEKLVTYSDYDHYFHVNNTKYADFFMDTFSIDEMKGKFIGKLQISYVKQCKLGEVIKFYKMNEDGNIIVEGKVGDETRVQFCVELSDGL